MAIPPDWTYWVEAAEPGKVHLFARRTGEEFYVGYPISVERLGDLAKDAGAFSAGPIPPDGRP